MRAAAALVQMNSGIANLVLVQCGRDCAIPKGKASPLGRRSAFVSKGLFEKVPPAILKARESLGLVKPTASPTSNAQELDKYSWPAEALPSDHQLAAVPSSSSTGREHASEESVDFPLSNFCRRRSSAPLLPASPVYGRKKRKASAELALAIAVDENLAKHADEEFENQLLAEGTVKVKGSMDALWVKICEARKLTPYPLSPTTIMQVAAVMKAAGYRSIPAYLYQARQVHVRAGHMWTDELELALKDAKRGALRGLGPPSRAVVFPLSVLAKLPAKPKHELGSWPNARILASREVELSTLSLSSDEILLNEERETVALRLSVSKSDPQAKGCSRTLACCCSKSGANSCPFHAAKELILIQEKRTQRKQSHMLAWQTPLIGTVDDPYTFVSKEAVIAALRDDMTWLRDEGELPQEFHVDGVSGHSFRRSGAQQLALDGVPLDLIQHLARHSSQAILAYVEDALEKCPGAATRLLEHFSLQEQIASLVAKVKTLEDLEQRIAQAVLGQNQNGNPTGLDEKRVQTMIESFLRPSVVLNVCTSKFHSALGNQHLISPADWTTRCGWSWVKAGRLTRVITSIDDLPSEATPCEKCRSFGDFPEWLAQRQA